ncbi:MAG: 50S ribosomal protein L21 [Candidatus Aminicenantia bacterium]
MMAVIETSGKQYMVKEGDKIRIEKLEGKLGDKIYFKPLLIEGEEVIIGTPYVESYKVESVIIGEKKGKKVIVFKKKSKKHYKKKRGHRQVYSILKVERIFKEE